MISIASLLDSTKDIDIYQQIYKKLSLVPKDKINPVK